MATDYLSALNVGSGLNTTQIIDALVAAEQEPQEALVNSQKEEASVSISSFGSVRQNLTDFKSTMSAMNGVTGMSLTQTGSSVSATIRDDAKVDQFSSSFEVSQIAQSHTLVFDGFTSESANVGSGTLTFEFGSWSSGSFTVNSEVTGGNVTIENGSDTLAEVKDAINAADIGVTASILKQSDSNYALVLKSEEGAQNAMRISSSSSKTVSQTTAGVEGSTAEIQSVAGFASSDLSALSGKTLFLHDGTNSLSVEFSSAPSNLAAVVSAITSTSGYSDMNFTVTAGTNALTLTYDSSDGNVDLSSVSVLSTGGPDDSNLYYITNYDTSGTGAFNPANGLSVSQTTQGVTGSTAEVQSVAGFTASDISALSGKTLFFHDGTNDLSVSFSSTPADLAAVVSAITSATGYSDMNFSVSAGSNALTLTYDASDGDVALANVGYLDTVESVSASDANLSIDGVSVTRTSNTITDLIDGVTLTLNSTTSSAEIISGNWDSFKCVVGIAGICRPNEFVNF